MNPTAQIDPIAASLGGKIVTAEPTAPVAPQPKSPQMDPLAIKLGGQFVPVEVPQAKAPEIDPLAAQLGGQLVGATPPPKAAQPTIPVTSNAKQGTPEYFLDSVAQQLGGRIQNTIPPPTEAITPKVIRQHSRQATETGVAQVIGSVGAVLQGTGIAPETGATLRGYAKATTPPPPVPGWEQVDLKNPLAIADKLSADIAQQIPQMGATLLAGSAAIAAGAPAAATTALAFTVAWVMNAGETFNNMMDLGAGIEKARIAAAGGGTLKAVFDAVLPRKIFGVLRLLPKDVPGKTVDGFMHFLGTVLKDAGLEGSTEVTQEVIDMALEKYYGVSKDTVGTAISRLGNTFASAATTGGAFGVLEHSLSGSMAEPPAKETDREVPPSIQPDTEPTTAAPSAPTTTQEVPRTVPTPAPQTMDQVTATLRGKVVSKGGEAAVYGTKPAEDIRALLGLRSDAPMEKLEELGLVEQKGEGSLGEPLYTFTELVTGGANFQPMPLNPGWIKSTDPNNTEYKYTVPQGPTFDVSFTPEEGGSGTFTTQLNGEVVSAPTMSELEKMLVPETEQSTSIPKVEKPITEKIQPLYSLDDQEDKVFVPTVENFEKALPGVQASKSITSLGNPIWQLTMPNGQTILVSPEKDYIAIDIAQASEAYGEQLDPKDTRAVGKFYMVGNEGRIELARIGSGQSVLSEETFHAAMQMVLTEQERDTVIKGYGSEEKAAAAYVKLTENSPTNKFFRKIRDFFQRISDIFAGQTPEAILRSVARGDVWTRMENTPEATIRGMNKPALKEMAALKKMFRNTPPAQKNQALSDVAKYFNATKEVTTLLQMTYTNPRVPQLQDYQQAVRTKYWMTKMDMLTDADSLLKALGKVGYKVQQLADKLIRDVERESLLKDRRLATSEIVNLARKVDPTGKQVAKIVQIQMAVDKELQTMLDKLETALIHESERIWGDPTLAALATADIQASFNEMRKVNYFPGTRFGKYGLQVKASQAITYKGEKYRKGEIIVFQQFERRSAADKAEVLAKKLFGGLAEVSQKPVLDTTGALLAFPPAVTAFLAKNLQLTPAQITELKEIQAAFSPGRGIVKHFIQKKGVLGASEDTMRVFADYAQHMSNHVAKIVSRYDMEQAIDSLRRETQTGKQVTIDAATGQVIERPISDAVDKGHMVSAMEDNYRTLLNPGNEMGALRGAVFLLYFGFYVKAAIVNLTQVPIFTWDYLAKRGNGGEAQLAITKAYKEVMSSWFKGGLQNTVSPADFAMLERGNREGFINESTASEVGALSAGSMLSNYFEKSRFVSYYGRQFLLGSVAMHKFTEVLNRRVTFLAALKVGRSQKLVGEALYQFAMKAVDMTQFEYARWNKPKIMKGKTAPIFLFKQYQQHQLFYELSGEAGWRHYLALAAIGGLKGLPLWTELAALLGLTVTGLRRKFGVKDPKFDLEAAARKLVNDIGGNPDLVMNGASRYGFGLSLLNYLFGLPMPAVDFSSSVQMNKAIPFIVPMAQMAEGIKDKKTGMLEVLSDGLGAGSQTGMNFITALTDDTPVGAKKMLSLSRFMKDSMRAFDMINAKGYRNLKGDKLVDVDLQNPEHIAEIVAQAMGVAPSRVSREYSAKAFEMETKAYYLGWRENIINAWALAIMNDKEALPEIKENYHKFLKMAPSEYKMAGDELAKSLRERIQKSKLHELGLPDQKRYWELHKGAMKLYQTSPAPKTQPAPTQ